MQLPKAAKAAVTVDREITKAVTETVPVVELTLTLRQAETLGIVLGSVGSKGTVRTSRQNDARDTLNALERAGVEWFRVPNSDHSGSILFSG